MCVWWERTCFEFRQCRSGTSAGDWNSTARLNVNAKDVEMPAGHISLSLICPQCCRPTCCATGEIAIDKTHIRGSNYRVTPMNVTHSSHITAFHVSKMETHLCRIMLIIYTYIYTICVHKYPTQWSSPDVTKGSQDNMHINEYSSVAQIICIKVHEENGSTWSIVVSGEDLNSWKWWYCIG